MYISLLVLLVSLASGHFMAPPSTRATPTGFLDSSVQVDGVSHPYVVYVPADYDPSRAWPVILFLHGKGECGADGLKQVGQGIGRAIMNDRSRWPFIVVFPQKPSGETAWEDYDSYVMASLDAAMKAFRTDPKRVYLTGLSQGGHGTWAIGGAHSDRFAALVPICGYGEPAKLVAGINGLPIWAFHGGADDVVPPSQTSGMIEALKAAGAEPRYTEYPGVNHNSWDRAYAEPELPAWLLSKSK